MMRRFFLGFSALLALTLAGPACGQQGSFDGYLQQVAAKARSEGVSEATIANMLGDLTPNDRVLALDRDNLSGGTSAGFPPLAPYLADHNTAARINGGRRVYAQLGSLAGQVEARYGVPAPILIAIWGHETSYGAVRGNFDLARALATLAWEGRRRELFERELIDLLKIADTGIPRSTLVGSWAGAFGNPQFLPSVYLRVAVDADGDGRRDIWNNEADTLASIANYFRDAGLAARPAVGGARLRPEQRRPRGDPHPGGRAGLPAGPRAPQPLDDGARMARAGGRSARRDRRRHDGLAVRARRSRGARLPLNAEL
jgi:lytic murein transglycosylase